MPAPSVFGKMPAAESRRETVCRGWAHTVGAGEDLEYLSTCPIAVSLARTRESMARGERQQEKRSSQSLVSNRTTVYPKRSSLLNYQRVP